MKRLLTALFVFVILLSSVNQTACATSSIRSNVTEKEFSGNWILSGILIDGYFIPADQIDFSIELQILEGEVAYKVIEE